MTILLYVNIQKKNIFCEDFDTLTHGVRSPPPTNITCSRCCALFNSLKHNNVTFFAVTNYQYVNFASLTASTFKFAYRLLERKEQK